MLTFILSMRARALSRNWAHHTWLLERTVDSVLAQTDRNFNVVVVCHDVPEIPAANHAKVHMLAVDFEVPQRNFDDMLVDKVLKISRGAEWAIEHGSDYVMFVDADDLVSRHLSAFVTANGSANGWYLYSGFVHRYGQRWMRAHTPHHLICGTSAIVRTNLLRFARDKSYRGENVNTLAAVGIGEYLPHLAEQGAPIQPLPFPGAVYVVHDDSTCEAPGGTRYRLSGARVSRPLWRRTLSWGKRTAKTLPRIRLLTPALRRDFSVPRPAQVPGAFGPGAGMAG